MGQNKPFWETIPGMLTALGGTIAAVAALITALYSAGVLGHKSETNSAPTVASQSPSPIAAVSTGGVQPLQHSEVTPSPIKQSSEAGEQAKVETVMSELEVGIDRNGGEDYSDFSSPSADACSNSCLKDPKCKSFVFHIGANQCWLKSNVPRRIENPSFISGVKIVK